MLNIWAKHLGFAFAAIATTGVVASPSNAEELRFTLWSGSDAHRGMIEGFAETFRQTHPDFKLELETVPYGEYVQKISLQRAAGDTPDIGWVVEASAPEFIDAGVLVNVKPMLETADGYDLSDFAEGAMGNWSKDDGVYGVPFSTSPFVMYYNKSLFEAAGVETPAALADKGEWTWDKFRDVAASVGGAHEGVWGYQPVRGEFAYSTNLLAQMVPVMRAFGGFGWNDGECGFNSAGSVQAVQFWHDMIYKDGSIVPPGEQGDFFTGGAAMAVDQMSVAGKLKDAAFEWGAAPMPTGPGGGSFTIGQAAIGVFSGGKEKLATEFLAHITNQENVLTMAEFFPPARRSVLSDPAFIGGHPLLSAKEMEYIKLSISEGEILDSHPKYAQIFAKIVPVADGLWKPDADVPAVLDRMCKAIQRDLRQ